MQAAPPASSDSSFSPNHGRSSHTHSLAILGVGFPRNSESTESKLFQTVLSACIADFQKFTISTPRGRRPSAASETAAAAPNSSFTATTAAASKVAVYETDGKEEGAARQASAQQQNGVTDATAERVDEAVTGETNISPAAPISEEHLVKPHSDNCKASGDSATARLHQNFNGALAHAEPPSQSPFSSPAVDPPAQVKAMNRNNEPPKRGGIVGSRWGPPPPPQGNADTKAKDALKTLGDEYQNQGSMSQGTAGGKKANPAQPAVKAAQNKGGFTGQDARAYGGPNMAIKPGAFPVNKPTLAPPAPKFAQNTGGFTSQDARAGGGPNMAIQRDAQAPQVKVSLKKGAVKVAAPAPAAARRPKAPSPLGQDPLYTVPEAPESTPAPTPSASKEAPKMIPVEEKEAVNVIRERPLNTAASSTPKKASKNEDDDSLHALFAKLKAGSPAIPSATGSATKKAPLSASAFVFETLDKGDKGDKGDKVDKKAGGIEKQDMFGVKSVQGDVASSKSAKEVPGDKPEAADASKGTVKHENAVPSKIAKPETANTSDTADEKTTATAEPPYMSGKNLEKQYLAKALEYVQALSGAEETPSWLLSTVTRKLRQTFKPNGPQDVEKLQSAVGEAIATYLNGLSNGKESDMKPKDAVQLLKANGGDFLKFNSDLTEQKFISLENLDDAIGLCKAILKALPDSDKKKPALPVFPVYKDPMDDMKAWPNALKRDNLPGCRTIMIKGVGDLKTVHQVQALVWGGAVESIHPAETGKDFAMIKFMTAAGCRKYFDTTENGIEVPNTKKVVFVERQPGPNSVNDVLQNCIDGNVTRCVRALGADEDWSAMALRKLAEGSDPKKKRQLDFVKRGKTARGYDYIEFRFGNIYDALNFKRELSTGEEWEHCTIGHTEDPCESATGVHTDD